MGDVSAVGANLGEEDGAETGNVDAAALAAELRASGIAGEVRFDDGSRALYATDYSVYRQVPIGVVLPVNVTDVEKTVAACRRHGAPVLGRGCGTSPNGQCCNVAVVLDFSKYMNNIVELDPDRRTARVQPGVVCDQLRAAAEEYGLTFGPDPATHAYCTLGGMIGNNSCGTHSVMAGQTSANVEELEVLLYDGTRMRVGPTSEQQIEEAIAAGGRSGEIHRRLRDLRDRYGALVRTGFPRIPRRCSGYNLEQLLPENGFHLARALVGSESSCVTVLEATVRLMSSPPHRVTVALGYPDRFAAGDHVPEVMNWAHSPTSASPTSARLIGLEGFDTTLTANMDRVGSLVAERASLPEGAAWLLAEFGAGTEAEAVDTAYAAMRTFEGSDLPVSVQLCQGTQQQAVWAVRQCGVDYSHVPGEFETFGTWEDAAVPPDRLGDYLRDFAALHDRYGYGCVYYGHFGQGCVHTRLDFDLKTAPGIARFRSFVEDAADLVASYGGSIAGEYGEGQRAELLPRMFGAELTEAFREFKAIWDPDRRMNPGKTVDSYPLDANLRFGAEYDPPQPETHFRFPDDRGSFTLATERCFGVGRCRKDTGTMCPSYQATREEMHTTRGRANLLFEMLQGKVVTGGWRDEHVKQALDLCLACKGCKGECPVKVDMATYKAEFLSHYYEGRLRPASAYALGLIPWWSRLASRTPGLVNLLAATPALASPLKAAVGIEPRRRVPSFAASTFTRRARGRAPRNPTGEPVILWPDTFNNHFRPETAGAAAEVLEHAGYRVELPGQPLCCGRPLYDYGMLDLAQRQLRQILDALRPRIRAGVPVVVLEPSCASVFRDELINLFPGDEDARRLAAQTFLLSELLVRDGYQPPTLDPPRRAVVHGHCHHKATMGFGAEREMLERVGLDVEVLDSGCCGLAGSWGYERDHYDISVRAAERVLLPAVRGAADDDLIVTDGFSCQSQIEDTTDRRAVHLAQVLWMALSENGTGGASTRDAAHDCAHDAAHDCAHGAGSPGYPEAGLIEDRPARPGAAGAAFVGAALAVGAVAWVRARRPALT